LRLLECTKIQFMVDQVVQCKLKRPRLVLLTKRHRPDPRVVVDGFVSDTPGPEIKVRPKERVRLEVSR